MLTNTEVVMKIAFFDARSYDRIYFDKLKSEYNCEIKYFESHLDVNTAVMAQGFEVVCVFVNDHVNAEVIEVLADGGTKLLALRCAGYNNVDFQAAAGRLRVVRVPEYSPYSVAEHAFALILSLNRKTHKAYNRTRDMNFNIEGLLGFDLYQKTIGVIGTGKIGRCFMQIAKGFGARVIAYDPFPNYEWAEENSFELVSLKEVYQRSDIISLHCPLTDDTHHLINEKALKDMKDGVMLINTSRGALIESKSLIASLKSGKVGFAGLDVYEEESEYFFEDCSNDVVKDDVLTRLLSFGNVIVTSHQAFFTKDALKSIAETTLDNIRQYELGNELENEICYNCGADPVCEKEQKNICKVVANLTS
jgi:D-lactate dehydrogenase